MKAHPSFSYRFNTYNNRINASLPDIHPSFNSPSIDASNPNYTSFEEAIVEEEDGGQVQKKKKQDNSPSSVFNTSFNEEKEGQEEEEKHSVGQKKKIAIKGDGSNDKESLLLRKKERRRGIKLKGHDDIDIEVVGRDKEMKRSNRKHGMYKGVRQRKWGKWVSEIRDTLHKTRIWLGSYSTPEMAARAYDVAAFSLNLAAANNNIILNFPELVHTLPLPLTLSTRDIQIAASAAAAAFRTHTSSSLPSSSQLLPDSANIPTQHSTPPSLSEQLSEDILPPPVGLVLEKEREELELIVSSYSSLPSHTSSSLLPHSTAVELALPSLPQHLSEGILPPSVGEVSEKERKELELVASSSILKEIQGVAPWYAPQLGSSPYHHHHNNNNNNNIDIMSDVEEESWHWPHDLSLWYDDQPSFSFQPTHMPF